MSEELLNYGFPILIAMVFVSFVATWILTAVRPPESLGEGSGRVNPIWKRLDSGPQGVRKVMAQEVKTRTRAA